MRGAAGWLTIAVVLLCAPARAAECPAPHSGTAALASLDPNARLEAIRALMRHDARNARIWTYVTSGLSLAGAAVNFTLAATTHDHAYRYDRLAGGIAGLITPLADLIDPLLMMGDQRALEAQLSGGAPGDVCATLAQAEAWLERDAKNAHRLLLLQHLGTALVALLGGIALVAVNHDRAALLQVGATLVIGEIQAWTLPTGIIADREAYLSGDLALPESRWWALSGWAGPRDAGLTFAVAF
ncbi:MAG: hypothetical protein QM723_18610 [Myxococcaceae bacterium]